MSGFPERPFNEHEQRYFLAEIIKDSEIPPSELVTMIQQMKVIPRWTEIALPNGMCTYCPVKVCQTRDLKVLVKKVPLGRSVSACQKAYNHLLGLTHPSAVYPMPYRSTNYAEPKPLMVKPKKRPYGSDGSMAVDRIIQPRTSEFSAVNETYQSPLHPAAPNPGGEPPKKKRGRPSKAEYEVRVAEYAARGEPYPTPRKSKASRHSTETQSLLTPTKIESIDSRPMSTLAMMEAGEPGSPSGKRRPRPNKLGRNFTLDTSALTHLPGETGRGDTNTAAQAAGERPGLEMQPGNLVQMGDLAVQAQQHPAHLVSDLGRDVQIMQDSHTPDNRSWQAFQAPKTN